MGLSIPDHEMEKCHDLMAPAWIAVALANDIFSWPKEADAATRLGRKHVVNAIWILMSEHGISCGEAERIARRLSAQYAAQYVETVDRVKDDVSLSSGLRTYIEAMQFSISGNIAWSKTCPRYNVTQSFSDRQREWMAHGVPEADQTREPTPMRSASPGVSYSHSSSRMTNTRSTPTSADVHDEAARSRALEVSFGCDLAPLSLDVSITAGDYFCR